MMALSDEAAAVVRDAILTALQVTGGGIEPEDDPDLWPRISEDRAEAERKPRAAYRLLDRVPSGVEQ